MTEYKLEVASYADEYHELVCEREGNSCIVSMDKLTGSPFNLQAGDGITARVSAKTQKGWAMTSEPNTTGAKIMSVPAQMPMPAMVAEKGSDITLSWEKQPKARVYELQWDQGNQDGDFVKIVETGFPSRTYSKMPTIYQADNQYRFRVLAKNGCGWGPPSEPLIVQKSTVPAETAPPVISQQACALNIEWEAPASDGGDAIKGYKIEVRAKNLTF